MLQKMMTFSVVHKWSIRIDLRGATHWYAPLYLHIDADGGCQLHHTGAEMILLLKSRPKISYLKPQYWTIEHFLRNPPYISNTTYRHSQHWVFGATGSALEERSASAKPCEWIKWDTDHQVSSTSSPIDDLRHSHHWRFGQAVSTMEEYSI